MQYSPLCCDCYLDRLISDGRRLRRAPKPTTLLSGLILKNEFRLNSDTIAARRNSGNGGPTQSHKKEEDENIHLNFNNLKSKAIIP